MVDEKRLAGFFRELVAIDSISKEEGAVAQFLAERLKRLGADVQFDRAGDAVGGQVGNLVARFPGQVDAEPMLINAHMDTVEPGRGINAEFEDGIFRSDGKTILGADDKSAVAVILEVLSVLKENGIKHCPLDVLFTVCEEVGLLGAKNLDFKMIRSRFGYALDAADTEGIVVRAPAANRFKIRVTGKAAHAGASPEDGVNAVQVAAKAIAGLKLGRIDEETTCNIGKISGGKAINIVPESMEVEGEVRSHDTKKLAEVTEKIISAFEKAAAEVREGRDDGLPVMESFVEKEFPQNRVPGEHYLVRTAQKAAKELGFDLALKSSGGGSDANIFFEKGIMTGVLGTGMKEMHSTREYVPLSEMVKAANLLLKIIEVHSRGMTGDCVL